MRSSRFIYVGLALVLIFGALTAYISKDSIRYSDEDEYDRLARSLVHRHAFAFGVDRVRLTAARPPGYPAVIAGAYLVDERPLAAKLQNVIFLGLGTLLLVHLTKRIDRRGGPLTPYLVLFYPLFVYAASVLYPQILGCLLLTTTVLIVSAQRLTARGAALAGLLYGILILVIPYFLVLLPLLGIFGIAGRRAPLRQSLLLAVLLFGVSGIVVGSWTVRNYVQFHQFTPVSANTGENLWVGNSPVTVPNGGVSIDVTPYCLGLHPGMNDFEVDKATRKCAVDWITQNPAAAARLYVGKVANYFNYRNELATSGEMSSWRAWAVFVTYYPLLLCALIRLALFRRYPFNRAEALIYAIYFINALLAAVFFTRLRLRIPFDFILIAVVAAFIPRIYAQLRGKSEEPARSVAVAP